MLNQISFQCLESSYKLGNHITREIWFITTNVGEPIRRTMYKAEDGSVVAIQDCGKGIDHDLYVETMFYELNKTEDAWLQIQCDSGVYGCSHIKLFDMR